MGPRASSRASREADDLAGGCLLARPAAEAVAVEVRVGGQAPIARPIFCRSRYWRASVVSDAYGRCVIGLCVPRRHRWGAAVFSLLGRTGSILADDMDPIEHEEWNDRGCRRSTLPHEDRRHRRGGAHELVRGARDVLHRRCRCARHHAVGTRPVPLPQVRPNAWSVRSAVLGERQERMGARHRWHGTGRVSRSRRGGGGQSSFLRVL